MPAAAAAQGASLRNVQVSQTQAATAIYRQTTSLPDLVSKAQGLHARLAAARQKTVDLMAQAAAARASMRDIQTKTLPELKTRLTELLAQQKIISSRIAAVKTAKKDEVKFDFKIKG